MEEERKHHFITAKISQKKARNQDFHNSNKDQINIKMSQISLISSRGHAHTVKISHCQIRQCLEKQRLNATSIYADGNCFINAILYYLKEEGCEVETVDSLRSKIADHFMQSMNNYINYLSFANCATEQEKTEYYKDIRSSLCGNKTSQNQITVKKLSLSDSAERCYMTNISKLDYSKETFPF